MNSNIIKSVMMKKVVFLFIILTTGFYSFGQKATVKWYTIQEAEKLSKAEPRPMIVDTYTDWCGWCKRLDSDTFSNPVIADILNSKFYPVKFDAEGKQPVTFQGRTFINDGKSGPSHQLAIALLQGQMSYPNLVFFNENTQLLTNVPGYLPPKEMEVLLSFFATKAYDNQKFQDFQKSFKGKVE
jgi:thioredoxin-related protein